MVVDVWRVLCEMRRAAAMDCVSEHVSEQLSRESCSEMRSETHSIAAAPRISQSARRMRRATCGGRRVERAFLKCVAR
eukprot:7835116-Lingulodinium_polyedra.AAC.1